MRIAIQVAAAGPAFAALVAALLMQTVPAAAQRICGDTAVEVSIQVFERRHADPVARILWSNCAQRTYGNQWSNLSMARGRNGPVCYYTRAVRSYYSNRNIITCSGGDVRAARWVCFFRATPCRYRYDGGRDREDDDD